MQIEHVRQRLRAYGAKPGHEQMLIRAWTQALPLGSGPQRPENFFPLRMRNGLPAIEAELKSIVRLRAQVLSNVS
jgi:23S rRNA (adenine2503-C2)-methyltransferase